MAFGDEKVVIEMRTGEHGELIRKLPDGREQTAHPHSNSVFMKAGELALSWAVPYESGSPLRLGVRGTAYFEENFGISVFGELKNKVKTLSLAIRAAEHPDAQSELDAEELLTAIHGVAMLGFSRADWELRSPDQWWLEVTVRQDVMDALAETLKSGLLREVRLTLRFKNLYSDVHPYAPVAERANLFLPPDKRDNSIGMPEIANGAVTGFSLSGPRVQLKEEPVAEVEAQPELYGRDGAPAGPFCTGVVAAA